MTSKIQFARPVHGVGAAAALALALLWSAPSTAQDEGVPKTACERLETEQIARYDLSQGTNIAKSIPLSLTGVTGNPLTGGALMVRKDRGFCTSCHAVSAIRVQADASDSSSILEYGMAGTIGPSLDGVADRYTEGELRLIVVNPKIALPETDTIMPAYHHVTGLNRVTTGCEGHALLTAGEVEDIVAYLMTLKEDP